MIHIIYIFTIVNINPSYQTIESHFLDVEHISLVNPLILPEKGA